MMVVMGVIGMRLVVWAVPGGGCVNALLLLLMCPPAGFGLSFAACRVSTASMCKEVK